MVYSSSIVVGNDDGNDSDIGGSMGGGNWLSESTDPVLDLLPDSYSNSNISLCKG